MSIVQKSININEAKENESTKIDKITNEYFTGSCINNTYYVDLTKTGKRFLILLLSYELNFEIQKLDYYFRIAKRLQNLFHIPGWKLLLPNTNLNNRRSLRGKIIEAANLFKSDISKEKVIISLTQAGLLNKAYNNFLWD